MMDVYEIDRSDGLKIMCYDIIDQFIRRAFGLLSLEDLKYIYAALKEMKTAEQSCGIP